jgi:thiamine biosynthesis lipoprotein
MGMPITIKIEDSIQTEDIFDTIFSYFSYVDETFSTYKTTSEISKINKGIIKEKEYSLDMQTIFALSEKTKKQTNEYFDIYHNGYYDPSGIVKGWAIWNASNMLKKEGYRNFFIEAGGDIQVSGENKKNNWTIGIRNPFKKEEIIKIIILKDQGIATSGTYMRGQHIYNPKNAKENIINVVSMTVIGPNVYEADRFATAAFAMGKKGIYFIESVDGLEGYMVEKNGVAIMTSNFSRYVKND